MYCFIDYWYENVYFNVSTKSCRQHDFWNLLSSWTAAVIGLGGKTAWCKLLLSNLLPAWLATTSTLSLPLSISHFPLSLQILLISLYTLSIHLLFLFLCVPLSPNSFHFEVSIYLYDLKSEFLIVLSYFMHFISSAHFL